MKATPLVQNKTAPIVNRLAELAGVKAILCFGSYAMGTFDQYSDFDLFVFCEPEIIAPSERRSVLSQMEGVTELVVGESSIWDSQWSPQGDSLRIGEDRFEITYNTARWLATVVEKVTETGATSIPELQFRPYTMLGLLENTIILHDPDGFLKGLVTNLYPYPPQLKQNLIAENLPMLKGWLEDLHDCAKREFGNTAFHFYLWHTTDAMCTILLAVNERYDPATKRTEEVYKTLKVLPPNFLERYTKLLEGPFDRAGKQRVAKELGILVAEVEQRVSLFP